MSGPTRPIPVELLRSVFKTDKAYQAYYNDLYARFGLDDPKLFYTVDLSTGRVFTRARDGKDSNEKRRR